MVALVALILVTLLAPESLATQTNWPSNVMPSGFEGEPGIATVVRSWPLEETTETVPDE